MLEYCYRERAVEMGVLFYLVQQGEQVSVDGRGKRRLVYCGAGDSLTEGLGGGGGRYYDGAGVLLGGW